jgi:hypothetical protein
VGINQTESSENQTAQGRRGGARQGAGRKRMNYDARTLSARFAGYTPMHAGVILSQCCDERKVWTRILTSEDDRCVLAAMQFLVSMRDGRPAQQINLTSFNLSVSAEDIASARAIVRELRGEHSPVVLPRRESESQSEEMAKAPLMLSGDEGGK